MNGRTTAIAVAAFVAVAGVIPPALAPRPSPDELERVARAAPKPPPVSVSQSELRCLALNVYWEARGEPEAGMAAVAHVTLNRAGSDGFPATVCGVVRQGGVEGPCQFHWYCDGKPDDPVEDEAWAHARSVAFAAMTGGADPTGGALYFHNRSLNPSWASARVDPKVIGQHVFFRLRGGDLGDRQLAQAVDP